jgi:hypothetical protein
MRRCIAALLSLTLLGPEYASAQTAASRHRVRFTTHEASWLSFDISPDGRSIVLDLLGQLWRLPARGGVARPITNAVRDSAELLDPAFALDGRALIVHGEYRGQFSTFSCRRPAGASD